MTFLKERQNKIMRISFLLIFIFISGMIFSQNDTTDEKNVAKMIFSLERAPEFVGGIKALHAYLDSNKTYTQQARKDSAFGTVYVNFLVTETGDIKDPEVLRGIHPDLDSITVDLIKNMPDWIPGEQRGQPIGVRYNLPIKFHLQMEGVNNMTPKPSKYWKKRGKRKFMKTCRKDYSKSQQECDCWYNYIIQNHNDTKLKRLDLEWIFEHQQCK